MNRNKGFTLIELLVVIIIIGILAAVAVPIMSGYRKRAIITEAVAALGTIRTGQRGYYVENEEYKYIGFLKNRASGTQPLPGIKLRDIPQDTTTYGSSDLDGTYFGESSYYVVPHPLLELRIICYTGLSYNDSPKAQEVANLLGSSGSIRMTGDGTIKTRGIADSGYEEFQWGQP